MAANERSGGQPPIGPDESPASIAFCPWCSDRDKTQPLQWMNHIVGHVDGAAVPGFVVIEEFVIPALQLLQERLRSFMKHSEPANRIAAYEACGAIEFAITVKSLIDAYQEEFGWAERACIVDAMGDMGEDLRERVLRRALNDESSIVRASAAEALGRLNRPKLRKLLEQRLTCDQELRARVGLLAGLILSGDTSHLIELVELAENSTEAWVRAAAANTMARVASSVDARFVAEDLRRCLTTETDVDALNALREALKVITGKQGSTQG